MALSLVRPSFVALVLAAAAGCGRAAAVQTPASLALRRVVVYRNGVGYFERQGRVAGDDVQFSVTQREVGDFLATLAVMEAGGSSVRAASFPMPARAGADGDPDARRTVRVSLDGRGHDLRVGYTAETPIWRPSYRLVFNGATVQVQAWGIVQNLSGEDWSGVRLSLVAGAPVSFRSELAEAVVPTRPVVTDQGAVIDAVPVGDTTLAQDRHDEPATAAPTPIAEVGNSLDDDLNGVVDEPLLAQGQTVAPGGRVPAERLRGMSASMPRTQQHAAPSTPAPTSAPRNLSALAALALQSGTTRYDLPQPVTVPDRSATMVMLLAREVPGARMYLFAPDPGVPDSATHPFQVARFENRTGALMERGPIAIFEAGDYLGQALLDPLPDAATATLPFALERALAVESTTAHAIEGGRLVRMERDHLTVERFDVVRTTWRVRNGTDRGARVMIRHALDGAELHAPPPGTERSETGALVPAEAPARGHADVVVVTRRPFAQAVTLAEEGAALAIEQYLRDAAPAPAVAATLRTVLDLRRQIAERTRERDDLAQRRDDLREGSEETRENLLAIQRNPQAADLRARLTARLGRVATEVDQLTRRVVDLDTQISERRVRLAEATRSLDIDTARGVNPPPTANATPPGQAPAPPAVDPSWTVNALPRRGSNGQSFTYGCAPGGAPGRLWGGPRYTDDSSVCTAAVHAGRISLAAGGSVTIEVCPGRERYAGSERHGVRSLDFARWPGSFLVR
ncbi:MAG: LCCL domain-containing protein [Polyangiales bacterium]